MFSLRYLNSDKVSWRSSLSVEFLDIFKSVQKLFVRSTKVDRGYTIPFKGIIQVGFAYGKKRIDRIYGNIAFDTPYLSAVARW